MVHGRPGIGWLLMPKATRDSGTPRTAEREGQAVADVNDNEQQVVDIARLLDANTAAVPSNSPADAGEDEEETGTDLSNLAEHDGEEDSEAPDDENDEESDAEEADEAEAEEDGEGEDEDESEPPIRGLTPAAQHAFNKLVTKEKGRRRELEGRLQEREAEIERLQAENAGLMESAESTDTTEPALLAAAKTEAEVRQVEGDARKTVRWAARQLDMLRYDPTAVEAAMKAEGAKLEEFSEKSMAEWLHRVRDNAQDVMDASPARLKRFERQGQFQQSERRFSADAERLIPWLKKADSPEMGIFNEVLKQFPEIKRRPNWKALAAAHVEGLKVIRARAQKAADATEALRRKPTPSRKGGEPTPVNPKTAKRAAAFSKVMKGEGNLNDVAQFLG